ncbi:hypothetical protein BVC80_8763g13 [Macleaya cordata]|uniref:Uncharacterized protein n=1 Tax=Macleaya cordata TaxID=56857 RepID=A0A200QNA3_MACCD|nr:hypothetical protein BVC80_8763g13 [Macleaya cordata]
MEDESDEEDEEERESSVDLLVRFVQSMFKKLSKRAKKATRSILPPAISPQLVSFAVDGVLLLTSLSIVKALLQGTICTNRSVMIDHNHPIPCVLLIIQLLQSCMHSGRYCVRGNFAAACDLDNNVTFSIKWKQFQPDYWKRNATCGLELN